MNNNKYKLTKEEQELEKSLAKGEWESGDSKEMSKVWGEAVENFRDLENTKSITMRVKNKDLIRVKARAKRASMPYQTLLKIVFKQFADGKLSLKI